MPNKYQQEYLSGLESQIEAIQREIDRGGHSSSHLESLTADLESSKNKLLLTQVRQFPGNYPFPGQRTGTFAYLEQAAEATGMNVVHPERERVYANIPKQWAQNYPRLEMIDPKSFVGGLPTQVNIPESMIEQIGGWQPYQEGLDPPQNDMVRILRYMTTGELEARGIASPSPEDSIRQSLQNLTPPSPRQSGPVETMPSAVQTPGQVEMQGGRRAEVQGGLASVVSGSSRNVTDTLNMGVSDSSRSAALPFKPQRPSEPFSEQLVHGMRGILQWGGITGADPIVGHGQAVRDTPGYVNMEFSSVTGGGVTVPAAITERLQQTAVGALGEAGQRFGGMSDPLARAINVRDHVYKSVMGVVDNLEKEAKAMESGGNKVDAQKMREMAQRAKVIATDMVSSGLKAVEDELGPGGRSLVFDLGKGMKMGPKGLSELLASDAISDTARAQIRQQAAEADNATFGKRQTFTFQTGGGGTGSIGFDPGMREGGEGGRGGRGGIWGGDLGSAMYGAYIARRFWGYTGAPVMQATEEYAQTMGALAPIMTGEIPTEGPGALYAKRERSKFMLGAAGYRLVGGALGAGSEIASDPGVATGLAGAGLFGGAALGTRIMGAALGKWMTGASFNALGHTVGLGTGGIGSALNAVAAPIAAVGGLYTGMQAASSVYESQGKDVPWYLTGWAGLQSAGILGAATIAGTGRTIAGWTGREEQFAKGLGQTLENPMVQRFLTPMGETPRVGTGSELATAKQINSTAAELGISEKEMEEVMAATYQATGSRDWTSKKNKDYMASMANMMKTEGMSAGGASSGMSEYGAALGYRPEDKGFTDASTAWEKMSPNERAVAMEEAQGAASASEIARQSMSRDAISDPSLRAAMRGLQTGMGRTNAAQYTNTLRAAGVGENISTGISTQLFGGVDRGEYTMNQAQFAAGMMGNLAPYMTSDQMIQMGGGMTQMIANLSVGQQTGIAAAWSGDIAGMSTAAMEGNLGGWAAWNDATGRQMYQTDVGAAMAQARSYDQFTGTNFSGLGGIGDMRFANMSGSQRLQASMNASGYGLQMSSRAATTIDQGYRGLTGMRALGLQTADIQYGAQMASAGLQIEGINARREMLWGSGSWDNPSANSLWGLENRQRGIQWSSTQQDWAAQQWRMQSQNQAAIQQENLSQERMGAQRAFQTYQFGYERSGALLQRGWAREDYQYQDQMRGLQFGWGMEDINEQIRMSSGRQRRQLVKQRGRMVTTQNLEEEQVDEQRSRQDQLWAREDEQFQKRVEYSETINELDDKQFELTKSRREELFVFETEQFERHKQEQIELHAIQEQIIQLNRKYQAEEMDRSERAAKIQMGAAAAAKEYNDLLAFQEDLWEESSGHFKTISEQERARLVMKEVVKMTEAINDVDVGKLRYIIKFLEMELKGL